MKKYIYIAMAAAAMLGCSKNEVPSADKNGEANEVDRKYVIYAEDINTKTVTDNTFSVKWTDKDNLAVYTWPVGTALPANAAEWQAATPVNFIASSGGSSPRPFSLSGSDDANSLASTAYSGRHDAFKKRYGEGNNRLQWGVIYPGKQSMASKPGMGIVVFGDYKTVRQRQDGNDNMSHLAFQDVLWGKAEGTVPTIKMKHLGTLMVYTVENETTSDFIVKSIKINVPGANIGGDFRFNIFEGTFDSCSQSLNECTLWVENGAAIPAGRSAKFYQVLAPFSLQSGNKITMTVETDKSTWTKTMTLDATKSFESGKKNTATLKIDVELNTHTDEDVNWFSTDSNLGKYINMANGVKYSYGNSFNQADIDIVVFRGNSKTALTFAAPTDSGLQEYIDNSIKSWTKTNDTKVKKVAVDFDSVSKMSELRAAYNAATGEDGRCVLQINETAIVKTVDGEFALIKVIDGSINDKNEWANFKLSIKTVE